VTEIPDVQYAKSGDVSIAYQVIGSGPTDVVFVRGFTGDLLSAWDEPLLVRHLEGLASNGRLLVLDKRGTGLSDRVSGVPTIETRMDDVRAVMDAEGSQQAVLWSGQEGTHVTAFFAATYPERTLGLVLLDPSARATPSDDYPWAVPESEWMERLNDVRANWGKREYFLRRGGRVLTHGDGRRYLGRPAGGAGPHAHPVLARAARAGGVLRGPDPRCADP
jgi:pimeloyl-ACP methyl ester carboxylesterase